jgi:hypothetical protein
MRSRYALLSALLLLAGCTWEQPTQSLVVSVTPIADTKRPAPIAGEVVGDFVIGEPIRYARLTVFPIYSRDPKMSDRFITLDEGLASGKVEIHEVDETTEFGEAALPNDEADDTAPAAREASECGRPAAGGRRAGGRGR